MTLKDQLVAIVGPDAVNIAARDYTELLVKRDIIALYQQFGVAHFQIGPAYPYLQRLDPQGLINPGVLGLPLQQ